jgi:ABC-type ATPase with predicted acetyltransferase domain
MEFTSFVVAVVIASSLGPENIVRRIDLGEAVMVLPEGYRPQGGRADVILHVLAFAGDGPDDHMRHLRRIDKVWLAAIEVDRQVRVSGPRVPTTRP